MPDPEFIKYERGGAYHWQQADPAWRNFSYNAPLVARYTGLAKLVPPEARTILDLGCGDGYLIHLLHRRGAAYVVGVDNNLLGVRLGGEQLRKRGHLPTRLCAGSAYDLPFDANAFDGVTMADVIEHLSKPETSLAEISRVLRDNGTLVLSTPNRQPDRSFSDMHVQEFSPNDLRDMLTGFFRDVRITGCWPMRYFRLWERGGLWRRLLAALSRMGINPFETTADNVSVAYGQLLAICRK